MGGGAGHPLGQFSLAYQVDLPNGARRLRLVCDGPGLRPSKLISHKGHQPPQRCEELLTPCWSWHPPVKPSGVYSPSPETASSHQGSATIQSLHLTKPMLAVTEEQAKLPSCHLPKQCW